VLGGELLDRERHRRMVEADRHVDIFVFKPAARDGGTDIGLVLMIREDDLDRFSQHRTARVLCRHAGGGDRTRTTEIGIETGLVVEHADLDDVVGNLRACAGRIGNEQGSRNGQRELQSHGEPPEYIAGPCSRPLVASVCPPSVTYKRVEVISRRPVRTFARWPLPRRMGQARTARAARG
jgi:hypothetical protein